jgi:uncharacterized protein DUF3303
LFEPCFSAAFSGGALPNFKFPISNFKSKIAFALFSPNANPHFLSVRRIILHLPQTEAPMPQYMIIEHFKNNDAAPIYRRFRDQGRMTPEGLLYISSWIDENLTRCYQLMETNDRALIDNWIANWSDLIDFEVHPVISSAEAVQKIAPLL